MFERDKKNDWAFSDGAVFLKEKYLIYNSVERISNFLKEEKKKYLLRKKENKMMKCIRKKV